MGVEVPTFGAAPAAPAQLAEMPGERAEAARVGLLGPADAGKGWSIPRVPGRRFAWLGSPGCGRASSRDSTTLSPVSWCRIESCASFGEMKIWHGHAA